MRRLWSPGAQPEMPFLAPSRVAGEPMGALDAPGPGGETVATEPLVVAGWALFPSGPTAKVEVMVDGRPVGRARLGGFREELPRDFDMPEAAIAGFEFREIVDVGPPGSSLRVTAVATSAGGETVELEVDGVQVIAPESTEDEEPLPPARTPVAAADGRLSVVVFTHQLNLGGAQLYLMDLIRELRKGDRVELTVASAFDGLLRQDLEAMGIPVHLFGIAPFDDLSTHIGRVEELAGWCEGRGFDVAFVNTATALALPGAEAAEQLGIPVVWAIHESFEPVELWAGIEGPVRERSEATVGAAERLVFEADATRHIYEKLAPAERCLTVPYGLDMEPIDARRATFDRAAERRKRGIPEDAQLVVCVGTVEPRKAQSMLAVAFDLVAPHHPRARLAFVGGRKDRDSEALEAFIDSPRTNDRMELIPITPDVEAWYGIADLLVCASDVESLPRTVLEAMAWETPVLATDVFGLPDVVIPDETGWLCAPRDATALAAALERALGVPAETCARIGAAGRRLVAERHSLPRYAAEITKLLEEAAAGASVGPPEKESSP